VISEFSGNTGISAGLRVARVTYCQFCLSFTLDLKLSQTERHRCNHWDLEKQAGESHPKSTHLPLFISAFMEITMSWAPCLAGLVQWKQLIPF